MSTCTATREVTKLAKPELLANWSSYPLLIIVRKLAIIPVFTFAIVDVKSAHIAFLGGRFCSGNILP